MSEEEKVEQNGEEQKSSQPSGGGEPSSEEKRDRPWKNVAKEYERKLDSTKENNEKLAAKLNELEQRMESKQQEAEKPDSGELTETLEELGYEKDLAEKMQKQIDKQVDYKTKQSMKSVKEEVEPIKRQVYKSARDKNLKQLEQSDDIGVVSKYRDEIEDELDKYPAHTWGNEEAIEMAVGKITRKHMSEIIDESTKKEKSPTETSHKSGSKSGVKVSEEAKKKAEQQGLDPEKVQKRIDRREKILEEQLGINI